MIKIKKRKILFLNLKKPFIRQNYFFIIFQKISLNIFFLLRSQVLTFNILPTHFLKKDYLKRIQLSFYFGKIKNLELKRYSLKKRGRIFLRKIFNFKSWVISTTIIHQFKGKPLLMKENFKIF